MAPGSGTRGGKSWVVGDKHDGKVFSFLGLSAFEFTDLGGLFLAYERDQPVSPRVLSLIVKNSHP